MPNSTYNVLFKHMDKILYLKEHRNLTNKQIGTKYGVCRQTVASWLKYVNNIKLITKMFEISTNASTN